jgi:uncharacterized protein
MPTTNAAGWAPWKTPGVQRTGTVQYTRWEVAGVWAAAALPMAALAWVVAPWVAGQLDGPVALARTLLALLTVGLI